MATNLNYCSFIGHLGRSPEMRYLPSGDAVASFSLAVGWKSKDKEGVEWVNIVAFGKLAEICQEYLTKGSKVFVSGRLKNEKYTKDGAERHITKIVADKMEMLGPRPNRETAEREETDTAERADTEFNDHIPF